MKRSIETHSDKGECTMLLPAITGIHKWKFDISTIRRTRNSGGEIK